MTPWEVDRLSVTEHACKNCGGTGLVRVHGAEDYGVSFESELCEHCGGTGVDVEALKAAYRGAVAQAEKWKRIAQDRCTCVVTCGDRPEDEGGICKNLPRSEG